MWRYVNHDLNQQPLSVVSRRALFLVQYCSQYTLAHLLFSWKLYIKVEDTDEAKHKLSSLLSDMKIWMAGRKLKLNDGKTEIIVSRGNLKNVSVPNFGVKSFGDTQFIPCESTKNLGAVLNSSLSF